MTGIRRPGKKIDAAREADVCLRTVDRWIARGQLRAYKLGPRMVRVDLDDVAELLTPIA